MPGRLGLLCGMQGEKPMWMLRRKNKHSRLDRCDCGCGLMRTRVQFIPSCYCGACGWAVFDNDGHLVADDSGVAGDDGDE